MITETKELQDPLTNAKLESAKLALYLLMYAIIKVNPNYFSAEVYKTLALQEKYLIKQFQELDEGVTVNDLLVSLFEKERMH